MDVMYRVSLKGVKPGVDAAGVRGNLARLFNATPEQVEALLSPAGRVIKSGLTMSEAARYHAALEGAGAACVVEPEVVEEPYLPIDLPDEFMRQRPDAPPTRAGPAKANQKKPPTGATPGMISDNPKRLTSAAIGVVADPAGTNIKPSRSTNLSGVQLACVAVGVASIAAVAYIQLKPSKGSGPSPKPTAAQAQPQPPPSVPSSAPAAPASAGTTVDAPVTRVDFSISVDADAVASSRKLLDNIYGHYDKRHECWIATDDEKQRYCMKIDQRGTVTTTTGDRLYVLAAGEVVDDAGEPTGVHSASGLVGAFVVEDKNGQAEVIAGNPMIYIGAFGSAPTHWKLINLGPSDYNGWQNKAGDCHQGSCEARYSLLAPYGNTVRDLAGFAESSNDEGAHEVNDQTRIETKLVVDSTTANESVFPLLITVTGVDKGKPITPKTWTIPFDRAKWKYTEPKGWPLPDQPN